MKVDDFAYKVAVRTLDLLEETHHYKIPEQVRKEICQKVQQETNKLLTSK